MIAIDSSAVIATVMREADERLYVVAIRAADSCVLSAANYLECAIVLTRFTDGRQELDEWIDHFGIEVVSVDLAQARIAADAFARFGRGQHPARLNYGDCFAYALAASRGIPLLYKGIDFGRTDVGSALAPPT
jgi:ribonuclease VapC